jgi:hypothetical protein
MLVEWRNQGLLMAAPEKHRGDRMKKAHSVFLVIAAAYVLNTGLAIAEEPATTPPAKPETTNQAEKPATPKEETTSPKPAENGTDKPKDDPSCE